jgi:glucokinase
MSEYVIGVDLGGTRVRAACLDRNLNVIKRVETLTLAHEGLEPTLGRIKDQIRKVLPESEDTVMGIGISSPGPLDPSRGVILSPPNLPGWHDVPLGAILHDEFHVPIYTGNDANVAALAEAVRGAAQGYRNVIYLTVSTGIGSGIITDGRLLLGTNGLAAEAGHMVMLVGDRISSLEEEAAGPDMAAQARARIQAGEPSQMTTIANGDVSAITGSIVGRAAQEGDPLALEIVRRSGKLVGLGIVTLLHLFNPQIIVIGGGVSKLGDLIFDPMRAAIEAHAIDDDYWKDLIITQPALGEDVSIVGAATLVVTAGGVEDVAKVAQQLSTS